MKPGRELDALVAEKVMDVVPCEHWSYFNPYSLSRDEPHAEDHDCRATVFWPPPYSTKIAAAWEVVEKARDPDFVLEWEGYWRASFCGENENAIADTAPHAICLAALKAVEVDT